MCFVLVARQQHQDLAINTIIHEHGIESERISTDDFVHLARAHDFKARKVKLRWEELFNLGEALPLICRTSDDKSFLLSGIKGGPDDGKVALLEPTSGKTTFTILGREELEEFWSGDAVMLRYRPKLTEEQQPFSLRWFLREMLRHRTIFRDIALATFLLSLFKLAFPLYFMVAVNKVLANQSLSTLYVMTSGILIVVLFQAVFYWLQQKMMNFVAQKIDVKLMQKTFMHMMNLPLSYFDRVNSGILLRNMHHVEKIRSFLTDKLLTTLVECATLIIIIPVIMLFHWSLALISIGFSFLIAGCMVLSRRTMAVEMERLNSQDALRQKHLVETVQGIRNIKSLSLEPWWIKRWDKSAANALMATISIKNSRSLIGVTTQLLQNLERVVIVVVACLLVLDGLMSGGAVIAVALLSRMVSGPLVKAASLFHEFQGMRLSVEMLGKVLSHPRERLGQSRGLMKRLDGDIEFDNVSFMYGPEQKYVLKDFTTTLKGGSTVGILGKSGSGKSTIAALLQGLYPVMRGSIRISGVDIRELDLHHLRRSIGVVPQDSYFFSGTIKDNICAVRPSATLEEAFHAASIAGADEFIQNLPSGYNTMLSENARNLSGGQRQRIAIARTILGNPQILILDEATSAIDPQSAHSICSAILQLYNNRTVFIVTHDSSLLKLVDRIVYLDDDCAQREESSSGLAIRSVCNNTDKHHEEGR